MKTCNHCQLDLDESAFAKNQPRCRECSSKAAKASRAKNPERFKKQQRNWYYADVDKSRKRSASRAKKYRTSIRDEFLREYGGACKCCGEDEVAFLTLEHTKQDGHVHRKQYPTTTQQLADLKERGWPKDDYAILCFNCNRATYELGVCPHQLKK